MTNCKSHIALGLLALTLLSACDNGCEQTREAYCALQLTATSGAKLTKLSLGTAVLADTLSAEGQPVWNEVLFATSSTASQYEVILDPNANTTVLHFDIHYSSYDEPFQAKDTLTLHYEVAPYYLDMECGCTLRYELQAVDCTGHLLRNVRIVRSEVSNEPTVNIVAEF